MKMTNQKISTSLLLTLSTMCLLLSFSLSPWENAEAGRYKPDWLLQKEQKAKEKLANKSQERVFIAGASDASSTKPELPKMYFGDNRLLWKAGLQGDFQTTFLPLPPDLGYVTVDAAAQKIYFMGYFGEFIWSMDFDGGNVEEVLSEERLEELGIYSDAEGTLGFGEPGQSFINIANKKVYWTNGSTISHINLDGTGQIEDVVNAQTGEIWLIFFDEVSGRLYWVEEVELWEEDISLGVFNFIVSANLDGSDIKPHVGGINGFVEGVCVDSVAKQIYWIVWIYDEIEDAFLTTIRRASLDGLVDVSEDGGEIVINLGDNFSTGIFVGGNNRILSWFEENYSLETDEYLLLIRRANLDDEPPTPETVVETRSNWLNHGTISLALGKLYWTESDQLGTGDWIGSVWSASLDGTEEPKNLTNIDFPGGIAADTADEKLYWTVPNLGMIRQANIDGTDMVDLITDLNQPEYIVISPADGKIYWTEIQDDVFFIQMANLDGTLIDSFATEDDFGFEGGPTLAIDVREKTVYWMGRENIVAKNTDGTGERRVVYDLDNPFGIAVDSVNRHLYWTEPASGTIKRSNLDGTRIRTIVSRLINPRGISLDPVNEKNLLDSLRRRWQNRKSSVCKLRWHRC